MVEKGYTGFGGQEGYDETYAASATDSGETSFEARVDTKIKLIERIIEQADEIARMVEEGKDGWQEEFNKFEDSVQVLVDGLSEDIVVLDGIDSKRPGLFDELIYVIDDLKPIITLFEFRKDIKVPGPEELMTPSQREQELLDNIKPLIIEQMHQIDPESLQKYQQKDNEGEVVKEVSLFQLGQFSHTVTIGNVECQCAAFLGEDGEFYIEGPRRDASSGEMVVDIHPYGIEDAMGKDGWFDKIRITQLIEATVACTI